MGRKNTGPIRKVTLCRPMQCTEVQKELEQSILKCTTTIKPGRAGGQHEAEASQKRSHIKYSSPAESNTEDSVSRQPQQQASVPEEGSQQGCVTPR